MKARSIKCNHIEISIFEEISSYLTSAVIGFFKQIRVDQEKAKREQLDKRRMLNQYHQEMFDGLPLEERLKTSNYRFK
jgi:hypothetical protein